MNTDAKNSFFGENESERKYHRELLFNHIDFVNETLAGLQEAHSWQKPVGCPHSTPNKLARRKSDGSKNSCLWEKISDNSVEGCHCNDPLASSEEPLDAVAAAILTPEKPVSEMYYTQRWRQIISELRENVGSWDEIAALDIDQLKDALKDSATATVPEKRVDKLAGALEDIRQHEWTDGVTLGDLPSVRYSALKNFLMEEGKVSEDKAYWLMLTAFDKPVFPVDENILGLLRETGFVDSDYEPEGTRARELENKLIDRQIPALNRTIASHRRYCENCAKKECGFQKFSVEYRIQKQEETDNSLKVADLFSGAGGISHGFERAGYNVDFALDKDEYATDTHRLNHPSIPHKRVQCKDITGMLENEELMEELKEEIDVVVGGPPCQALSKAGYRARLANDEDYSVLEDERTELYRDYVEAIQKIEPEAFLMENVEGLISEIGDTGVRVADQVVEALEERGYTAAYGLINTAKIGIPQKRRRAVVIGFKQEKVSDRGRILDIFEKIENSTEETPNLRQGLAKLPMIKCSEGGNVVPRTRVGPDSDYLEENNLSWSLPLNFNHQAREHPMDKDRKLFGEVMDPGDTGWEIKYEKNGGEYAHLIDYNVGSKEEPQFNDKYRMLKWNDPAPTVVAHLAKDANNFVLPDYYEYVREDKEKSDPERNRGVTPREAARLQSFPDDFIFLGPFTSQFRQVGNAVPPLMGQRLAEEINTIKEEDLETERAELNK